MTQKMEAQIIELRQIVQLKAEQGDSVSFDQVKYIEFMLSNLLKEARATLTECGQEILKERMENV